MATHPCSLCGTRVRVGDDLIAHLDCCRAAHVLEAARSWGLDDDVAGLFLPGTHDRAKMAAVLPPHLDEREGDEGGASASSPSPSSPSTTTWYATAASNQYGVAPLVPCPHLAAADSPAHHALILLPRGPSYVCAPDDMSEVLRLPLVHTATAASPDARPRYVRILVGSEAAARSPSALRRFGVAAVVNCAVDSQPLAEEERRGAGVGYYTQLQLVDAPGATNLTNLRIGAEAVEEAVRHAEEVAAATTTGGGSGGGDGGEGISPPPAVLIHCVAGISRSPSVAIAYLVSRREHTLKDAAVLVKRARKVAYPNVGFWSALRELEREARGDHAESIPDKAFALHKSCPITALRIR